MPLEGASVVMHPYRAVTDESGWAEMRVANGPYRLMVSQGNYVAFGSSIEATGETTVNAELDPEKLINIYDLLY